MSKSKRLILCLVLIFVICVPVAAWLYRQVLIDKCLDSGSAWDYSKGHCLGEESRR